MNPPYRYFEMGAPAWLASMLDSIVAAVPAEAVSCAAPAQQENPTITQTASAARTILPGSAVRNDIVVMCFLLRGASTVGAVPCKTIHGF
jgi:hypothetical protein